MITDFSQAAATRSVVNDAVRQEGKRVEAHFGGRMATATLSGGARERRDAAAGPA